MGSLFTLIVAAALALIGAVLNYIALLIAIVGLLVCVTAGWYAVSRRGVVRVIGLIVVVVALAGMITGLVLDNFSVLRILLVVVVAAVSVLLLVLAVAVQPVGSSCCAPCPAVEPGVCQTKVASKVAAAANTIAVQAEAQPQSFAFTIASVSAPIPQVTRSAAQKLGRGAS